MGEEEWEWGWGGRVWESRGWELCWGEEETGRCRRVEMIDGGLKVQ